MVCRRFRFVDPDLIADVLGGANVYDLFEAETTIFGSERSGVAPRLVCKHSRKTGARPVSAPIESSAGVCRATEIHSSMGRFMERITFEWDSKCDVTPYIDEIFRHCSFTKSERF